MLQFMARKCYTVAVLQSKQPLVVITAEKSYVVDRKLGVGLSKYAVCVITHVLLNIPACSDQIQHGNVWGGACSSEVTRWAGLRCPRNCLGSHLRPYDLK